MWWCLVATYNTVGDIRHNYVRFASNDKYVCVSPKLLPSDYLLLGYTVIVSPAMKSTVFEALFANI
ncbi:MAG: hypothetical protein ACOYOV_00065 [Bacteroidales bacterium]